MDIIISNKKKKINLKKPLKIIQILKKLNINPEEYIVKKNNELCLEEEIIENKDKIELISVVSGG